MVIYTFNILTSHGTFNFKLRFDGLPRLFRLWRFGMEGLFMRNALSLLKVTAVTSALIAASAFVAISPAQAFGHGGGGHFAVGHFGHHGFGGGDFGGRRFGGHYGRGYRGGYGGWGWGLAGLGLATGLGWGCPYGYDYVGYAGYPYDDDYYGYQPAYYGGYGPDDYGYPYRSCARRHYYDDGF